MIFRIFTQTFPSNYLPIICATFVFVLLFSAVFFGKAELFLWSQVTSPWHLHFADFGWQELERSNPVTQEVVGYPHVLRQLLTAPFFVLAILLNIDPNVPFSFSLPFAAASTVWCIAKTAETLSGKQTNFLAAGMLIPISLLFFIMDGRIPYVLVGFSLTLYSQLGLQGGRLLPRIVIASIGLLLASVATGSFLLIFGVIFLLDGYRFLKSKRLSEFCISFTCFIWAGAPLFWVFDKTAKYFLQGKNGIWDAFNHGFGKLFINDLSISILIIGFAIVLACIIYCVKILPKYCSRELLLVMAINFAFGVFGYTILVGIAVPGTVAMMAGVLKASESSKSSSKVRN